MKKIAMFAVFGLLLGASTALAEPVKFKVSGVLCPGCAGAVTNAVVTLPAVKIKEDPSKAKPILVLDIDTKKSDVGDVAKAIAAAETPHKDTEAPGATLIIEVKALTDANAKKVGDALSKVKGVDAKASKGVVAEKAIYVKLSDEGGAKLAEIKKALESLTK
jgi:copper chaperone CopZ